MTQEQLKQMADMVAAQTMICTKEVLTTDEAAKYMGIKVSYLYKLTMRGEIPHYKPNGKMCYFKRTELEQWLLTNPVSTSADIADQAEKYCMTNKSNI